MRVLSWFALLFSAACGLLGLDESRILGTISTTYVDHDLQRPAIEVPDTVSVSTPFTVSVLTEGGGCERFGYTWLLMDGNEAIVTPYDYTSAGNRICLTYLTTFDHSVEVTFDAKGSATVVVRGAERLTRTPVEYEYDVWVE